MRRISASQAARRVRSAASVSTVVAAAEDYVAGWNRAELAGLPENCRPAGIQSADDVQWWADTFGTECASGEAISPQLQAMCDFFRLAARRIRELGSRS